MADLTADQWVITELSLSLPEPPPENVEHPERVPVGPFDTRELAEEWASDLIARYGGTGSFSVAPVRHPNPWPES